MSPASTSVAVPVTMVTEVSVFSRTDTWFDTEVKTGASLTFETATVKAWLLVEPSLLVASTVIAWLVAASKFSAPARVTTPVVLLMANRPPGLDDSE